MSYGPNCGRCKKPKTTGRRKFKYCGPCAAAVKRESKQRSHEARVCDTYGLLPGDYEKLYEYEGRKCPVPGCRATGKTKRLAVDHDHNKGLHNREAVRGLLCGMHNDMVGKMRDNPEAFEYLADYLRNPPARKVLTDNEVSQTHGDNCNSDSYRSGTLDNDEPDSEGNGCRPFTDPCDACRKRSEDS